MVYPTTKRQFNALCVKIWREANHVFFGNKLPRVPYFRMIDGDDFGAWCIGNDKSRRDTIAIYPQTDANSTLFLLCCTIVHEMVHQEQLLHKSPHIRRECHGRFFRRRAAEIEPILGADIVGMYPKKGTPGYFIGKAVDRKNPSKDAARFPKGTMRFPMPQSDRKFFKGK